MKHLYAVFSCAIVAALISVPATVPPASAAEPPTIESVLGAVVALHAEIPADARTAESLGTERDGHAVVIDSSGLALTIGYLILEAETVTLAAAGGAPVSAEILAYDHATGFGLLRAERPLKVRPMALSRSALAEDGDRVVVAGAGGADQAITAQIVSRRSFAGYWEYMLDEAIFTVPPHPIFGGAALIDSAGRLLGIGSLFVNDAAAPGEFSPGNMFVPIDLLKPILADLIADGRSSAAPRPWLGLYTQEAPQGLFVSRVAVDGPAQRAGILPGSLVLAIDGRPIRTLESFYREVWAMGAPGVTVNLTLIDPTGEPREVAVVSGDRSDWLGLKSRD
ncbi:MAG: serine protease [Rhodospirillales bacterium]|nr:MAG: serine protease [Rhodospirillales bacterium]